MSSKRRQINSFLNATKFLLFAGHFLSAGLFFVFSYAFTDVDKSSDEGTLTLQFNQPVMFPIDDLEDGDIVYIEIESSDYVDVILDGYK